VRGALSLSGTGKLGGVCVDATPGGKGNRGQIGRGKIVVRKGAVKCEKYLKLVGHAWSVWYGAMYVKGKYITLQTRRLLDAVHIRLLVIETVT
jgi:hypothetical protein